MSGAADFALQPTDHFKRRGGKAYVWLTWLSRYLSGDDVCQWKLWFKARHKYQKIVDPTFDSAEYERKHNAMVKTRAERLVAAGYEVALEHELKWEGQRAVAAGRIDILATKTRRSPLLPEVLIDDVKTGNKHNRDFHQVMLYMLVHTKQLDADARAAGREYAEPVEMMGQVIYGDTIVPVSADNELTPANEKKVTNLLKIAGSNDAPEWKPSRRECEFCDIPKTCCPKRIEPEQTKAARSEAF
jgi:hypothetical protein